jgi:YegS/Rv2252/BmrU family lipid kinase
MRILLLANAHARRGKEPLDVALDVLARASVSATVVMVPDPKQALEEIRRRASEIDAIVLSGGDGTVANAAPALIEAGLPFGLLPRGTANDLARSVGVPTDLKVAAEVIAAGAVRKIDVGEVNGKFFFNVAHIGLGCVLSSGVTAKLKRRLGPLAYPMAAARALGKLKPFRAEISAGDERITLRTVEIAVGNGRYFGGGGVVSEDAEIDDGVFHVYSLGTKNPLRLAVMLPSLVRGRHGRSKWVRTAVAAAVDVRTVRPMSVCADGHVVTRTPAAFRVHAAALTIFAPPLQEVTRGRLNLESSGPPHR